ncbi:sodium:calcium antiporter (plasmid) [Peteryoungia desertarenae]|uniref:Sodium:calcium antiporter n=1 Tax=Peteryoungia desertarenae TaxID=1813451 RepID=A0ABX6QTK9_9HYPH|nr:sodium:calcium antiporter [Peteryoungia desertarenae]QLF71829.1 sodium:calcium antiporter [Peteryoungia desertarenae]
MLDFAGLGLWTNIAIFAVAAIFAWLAGARITGYANIISEKTGMGQALVGLLLLGGVTSLPELVVAVTSSFSGDASLAVNGILGGIAMQVAILAVADALIHDRALTSVIPNPVVFLQGGFKVLLLSIVAASVVVGDKPVMFVGIWMWLLVTITGISMFVLSRVKEDQPWIANDDGSSQAFEDEHVEESSDDDAGHGLSWAVWRAIAAGAVIVIAGYVLSRSADAIAEASGLGQSFVGAVFLAIATSLPEVSTVFTAMRAGLYTMAMSDIFGTNIFDLSFLFLIDLTGGADAVMNSVGRFEGFAALIAITATAIFLVGLAERRDKTALRMGYDSLAVLATYLAGLVVLYFLRDSGGGN